MATQAELETQLAALEAARGSATLRVRYADKDVTYKSTDEILRAIDQVKAELSGALGTLRRKIHVTDSPRGKGWTT